jgi:hypothetical protein
MAHGAGEGPQPACRERIAAATVAARCACRSTTTAARFNCRCWRCARTRCRSATARAHRPAPAASIITNRAIRRRRPRGCSMRIASSTARSSMLSGVPESQQATPVGETGHRCGNRRPPCSMHGPRAGWHTDNLAYPPTSSQHHGDRALFSTAAPSPLPGGL